MKNHVFCYTWEAIGWHQSLSHMIGRVMCKWFLMPHSQWTLDVTLHYISSFFFCYVLFIIVINVIRNHGNNARKLKVEVLIERVNELSWYGGSGHCFLPEPQLCWLTIHLHTCNKNDLFSYSISRATLRLLHFKDIRTGVEWMIIHFVGIKGEINSGVEQTQTKVKLVIVWTNKQEINVITNRKITTLLKSVCCDE